MDDVTAEDAAAAEAAASGAECDLYGYANVCSLIE
jgi:hypothetical protein